MTSLIMAMLVAPQKSMMGVSAPEFVGDQWVNASNPIRIGSRKGSVTLVHFWTFACINCQHNLPTVQRLLQKFQGQGVQLISVHTPELPEERKFENVKKAITKNGITYPVLVDSEGKNWNAWKLEVWPTLFVIDKANKIRGGWIGELNFNGVDGESQVSSLVSKLLREK